MRHCLSSVTENDCLPIVEKVSGLKFNKDFFMTIVPNINPGDKVNTVEKILKITSGLTPEVADIVDSVYNAVLLNGTYKAPVSRWLRLPRPSRTVSAISTLPS